MKGIEVLNGWKADIANLQLKLVELEREKKEVQNQLKVNSLYEKRGKLNKDIKAVRCLVEARSRELAGASRFAQAAGISMEEKHVEVEPVKIRRVS